MGNSESQLGDTVAPLSLHARPQSYAAPQQPTTTKSSSSTSDRRFVHLLPDINMYIMQLQVIDSFALVFVCSILHLWQGDFFNFGPPVLVRDQMIHKQWHFWLLMTMFAVSRLISHASGHVIGHFRMSEFERRAKLGAEKAHSFTYVTFIVIVDHAVNWLRYSSMVIFIYSQVSFALAFAVPDTIIVLIQGYKALKIFHRKTPLTDKEKMDMQNSLIWAKISPVFVTVLQVLEVVGFLVVFWVVGFMESDFFHFGPPVLFLGTMIGKDWHYVLLIFFAFIDQLVSTLNNGIVSPWLQSKIFNNSCTDPFDTAKINAVFITRILVVWIRTLVVANFASSQFMFVLTMFVADTLMTFALMWRSWAIKVDNDQHDFVVRYMPSVTTTNAIVVIEGLTVLTVALAMHVYRLPYFDFPPPLLVFDKLITTDSAVAILMMFCGFTRAVNTMTSNIVYPYINNVIYGDDKLERIYEEHQDGMLLFTDTVSGWIRRIVAFNFLFSNVLFIVIGAAVDITLSIIILQQYLKYKKRCIQEKADKNVIALKQLGDASNSSSGKRKEGSGIEGKKEFE